METQSQNVVIPEGGEDQLESTALVHVAKVGPNGGSRNYPRVVRLSGEHLKVSKAKTRQKYRNLQRDPRLAFSVVDPEHATQMGS